MSVSPNCKNINCAFCSFAFLFLNKIFFESVVLLLSCRQVVNSSDWFKILGTV